MAKVTITKPSVSGDPWHVDHDGVTFAVDFRRTEPDDPRLKEEPTHTCIARITRPDGASEARHGLNRGHALTRAATEMKGSGKLAGIDWPAVFRALDAEGALS